MVTTTPNNSGRYSAAGWMAAAAHAWTMIAAGKTAGYQAIRHQGCVRATDSARVPVTGAPAGLGMPPSTSAGSAAATCGA